MPHDHSPSTPIAKIIDINKISKHEILAVYQGLGQFADWIAVRCSWMLYVACMPVVDSSEYLLYVEMD